MKLFSIITIGLLWVYYFLGILIASSIILSVAKTITNTCSVELKIETLTPIRGDLFCPTK